MAQPATRRVRGTAIPAAQSSSATPLAYTSAYGAGSWSGIVPAYGLGIRKCSDPVTVSSPAYRYGDARAHPVDATTRG